MYCDLNGNPIPITIADRDTYFGVLSFLHGKYNSLANLRNDLLHGTWYIGAVSELDPVSSKFRIHRYKATKTGLTLTDGLPTDAAELKKLADKCDDVRNWFDWLMTCFEGEIKIKDTFRFMDGTWWFVHPNGNKHTLP